MQEPLKPINDKNDVVFSKFLGKNVVNLTLNKIIELGGKGLSKPLIVEIENYIYQDKLINENVREKFRVKHLEKVMKQREKKRFLNSKKIEYWDFVKAREFARSLKISSQAEWKKYAKESSDKPKEIPADPYSFYKGKGWESWGDWLGTTREFNAAREYVHSLKFKNRKEWRDFIYGKMKINKPTDIPNCPDKVYKNEGWSGYKDWLGHN